MHVRKVDVGTQRNEEAKLKEIWFWPSCLVWKKSVFSAGAANCDTVAHPLGERGGALY